MILRKFLNIYHTFASNLMIPPQIGVVMIAVFLRTKSQREVNDMPTLDLFDVHLIGLWPGSDVGRRSSLAPGKTKSRSAGGCAAGIWEKK